MGGTSTKELNDIVNESVSKNLNNIATNTKNVNDITIADITTQNLENITVTFEGCTETSVQDAKVNATVKTISELNTKDFSDFQESLSADITNKVVQKQRVKTELGGSWGSYTDSEVENITKNIVKNIINNTVTKAKVNEHIVNIRNGIKQNIEGGNITIKCAKGGTATVQKAGISLEAQITDVSELISNDIMNSTITTTMTNDIDQSQTVEQQGIGSMFAKMLLPLAIIGGIAVFFFGSTLKSLTNWKLWLVVALIFGLYILVAWFTKIWPFKKYYSPVLDERGFRTQQCVRDDKKGIYDSMSKCTQDLNNPKSMHYWNKFWGYDEQEKKCKQYPALTTTVKDKDGNPILQWNNSTQEECKDSEQKYYVPAEYNTSNKQDFLRRFGDKFEKKDLEQVHKVDGKQYPYYCDDNSYSYYKENCKIITKQNLIADLQQEPSLIWRKPTYAFSSEEECKNAINSLNFAYIPKCDNCSNANSWKTACQSIKQIPFKDDTRNNSQFLQGYSVNNYKTDSAYSLDQDGQCEMCFDYDFDCPETKKCLGIKEK